MKRFGVIDLGTNTFHLLIVEKGGDLPFRELYRERRFVKLAENGIEKIGNAPFERGLKTLMDYKIKLDHFEVKQIKAIGTAALRRAKNGAEFIRKVFEKTGIEAGLISGEEEARLIHLGVRQAVPMKGKNGLVMDIGGGSVEFIISNERQVFWSKSFPVGVAILFHGFHKSDPMSETEIQNLEAHLRHVLNPLFEELSKYPELSLIGASGAFEVIENMIGNKRRQSHYATASVSRFLSLHESLLKTTLRERLRMRGMPESRAELIIVAFILIYAIAQKANIAEIVISDYAMKEGALYEMMESDRG